MRKTFKILDYLQIVDTPMDLRTVKEDLLGCNYQSKSEFLKDVRIIFSNSRQYNTNPRSRVSLSINFRLHIHTILHKTKT